MTLVVETRKALIQGLHHGYAILSTRLIRRIRALPALTEGKFNSATYQDFLAWVLTQVSGHLIVI